MQEHSTPAVVDVPADATLVDAVLSRAQDDPDHVMFTRKVDGRWAPVTAKEFSTEVLALAAGLAANGVQVGDRVGLMSKTRYEWTLCDYAIWAAGGVTVPIYETSSAEQVAWNLGDSEAVAVVVESAAHQAAYDEVSGDLPGVRHVWQIDAGGLEELAASGREVPAAELEQRRQQVNADSLATIIYTSGTTGRPKGCELTHRNLLTAARTAEKVLPDLLATDQSTLMFLPLAHVFGRFIQVGCVESGARMGHTADIKNLLPDLQTFQPSFLLSVPRVFEKVYNSAKSKAHGDGKGKIFDAAEATAVAYSQALDNGGPGPLLKVRHALFDRLVFAKLRQAMGGKVTHAFSGGAPLGARLGHFFRGIGVTICEGYGLTETTAPATVSTPEAMKIGTVGRPMPSHTIRIADDGEVLVKGPHVFAGYWHNEQATSEAITDGWFHTGDIGELDKDGYLKITGRKKELIVTAGGKNVAPAVLEDRLRAHALVSQCMVVGDQRPFIGCLITLDAEALPGWLKSKGRPQDTPASELTEDADLLAELQAAVDDANKAVSKAEAIRKFAVLPGDWTEEGGQLTPSLKLKRSVVLKECAGAVDELYGGPVG